tara:strand:- start:305 stop:520 length:216 start_codon:yes stop_codon:yes gene_type:complete
MINQHCHFFKLKILTFCDSSPATAGRPQQIATDRVERSSLRDAASTAIGHGNIATTTASYLDKKGKVFVEI